MDLYRNEKTGILVEEERFTKHAYLEGKSVESVLHDVVGTIEKSLHHRKYTLVPFLDVEEVFNNVKTATIEKPSL